jgi:hypothetical protein
VSNSSKYILIILPKIYSSLDEVQWDADYYGRSIPIKGRGVRKEEGLQLRFPAVVKKKRYVFGPAGAEITSKTISEITVPCTILDIHGWILVWGLPEVLSDHAQVSLNNNS